MSNPPRTHQPITTGAERLFASGFADLKGKRVGLITNQTGLVGGNHLADLIHEAPNVTLAAIFAPEHGFRGFVEAGDSVDDGIDIKTGVPVISLYGNTRKPTRAMLRNIDVLVFDIQDVGVRFYTYISTMGLAMQAAAAANIPFVVLDRPNPLGGEYVSGFVRRASLKSFVGQYPIPIVHGLTVGELAQMIKGEKWLKGLDQLQLSIIKMRAWKRATRWHNTRRRWVATSPNIPTFESALVYPGMGLVGLTRVNEGRGTQSPFSLFGGTWFDGVRMAEHLNARRLPGVTFKAETYTPRSIKGVAARPLFKGQRLNGVRLVVKNIERFEPLETGIHVLTALAAEARGDRRVRLFTDLPMFHLLAGTKTLHRMLVTGKSAEEIIASWQDEVAKFKRKRRRYLLYRG